MKRRVIGSAYDSGSVDAASFNWQAGGQKNIEIGPSLQILGTLNGTGSLKKVGYGKSVRVYNNSASVGWIAFFDVAGGDTPAAPTGLADGIAVPANSYITVSSGTKDSIVGSAATLGAYLIIDDSSVKDDA